MQGLSAWGEEKGAGQGISEDERKSEITLVGNSVGSQLGAGERTAELH